MAASKDRRGAKASASAAKAGDSDGSPRETVQTREKKQMEAYGAGVLAVMFAYQDAAEEDSRIPKLAHAAKLFLIAVLFIAPVLLMWQHAF